ncbi:hypothetical protein ABE073_02850 [Lederbergia citrisecunda]|uniref:hypothetical protein n=1 Tax=Lederbergia citrisecunda TaxID=2833583 RepID=UPI003D2C9A39
MSGKYIIITIFSVFCILLSGCQKDEGLTIGTSSVEIGSPIDPDDRALHFRVEINGDGIEKDLEYKVRFKIINSYLRELIDSEEIELDDVYHETGLITGSSVELKKVFSVDEIRKSVEDNKGVIVELYNEEKTIKREVVAIFRENIKQLVKINPTAKIKTIELNDPNEIAIYRIAVSNSTKINYIPDINTHPKYLFNLDNESYYLWITEDVGMIMNTEDTFTIYSLSDSSRKEIKEIID